ncbi:helix-turn-helix domain-containing protein [Streptomyces sp. NPDC020801]|uniref:helix-turn-helix domain-containing protein n=1 Tax=Streptomyces sp. NPDC020801 TaxID=3365093 RepID=UPI0037A75142
MPRWKALPEEVDPQVREFASQLRRLVDRSGLSVAALADRTGYSKTSWDRYLNGRLLAPKGAVIALAEVTGTNPVHLTTMWELAERAWSRAEMRHDRTMEAIRIAQARASLGELGAAAPTAGAKGGKTPRRAAGTTAAPGVPGTAGVSPAVPVQPTASDADVREGALGTAPPASGPADSRSRSESGAESGAEPGSGAKSGARSGSGPDSAPVPSTGGNSWGLAGYRGPSGAAGRAAGPGASAPQGANRTPGVESPHGQPAQAARPVAAGGERRSGDGGGGVRRRQVTMFLAGLVGVLVVIGAVFFLTGGNGGGKARSAAKSPSPSASTPLDLPPGVKCGGAGCTGKDAESMGCSGELVSTAQSATVGSTVLEVRYSKTCGAAWGRITQAARGDEVQVTVGTRKEAGTITTAGDTIAYTPMIAVKDAAQAKACATLRSGLKGCTK